MYNSHHASRWSLSLKKAVEEKDSLHQLAARRQTGDLIGNLAIPTTNSPNDGTIELVVINDEEAARLGAFLHRHSYLQEIKLTLVASTDPTKGTASLIEYIRWHRHLTTLSIVTAYLLNQDGSSTLEKRELVVDALLKAAIDNPSVTSVYLNCCRYKSCRLVELLRKPGLRHFNLTNCQPLDDLSQCKNKEVLLRAIEESLSLETFRVRRSFESTSIERNILLRLTRHPEHPLLREIGLSIQSVATASTFRSLIDESFSRPMKFSLLGSELSTASGVLIIGGFKGRMIDFELGLEGCRWESDSSRHWFFRQLGECPRLINLSIDEHCGLSDSYIRNLEKIGSVRYRLTRLAEATDT